MRGERGDDLKRRNKKILRRRRRESRRGALNPSGRVAPKRCIKSFSLFSPSLPKTRSGSRAIVKKHNTNLFPSRLHFVFSGFFAPTPSHHLSAPLLNYYYTKYRTSLSLSLSFYSFIFYFNFLCPFPSSSCYGGCLILYMKGGGLNPLKRSTGSSTLWFLPSTYSFQFLIFSCYFCTRAVVFLPPTGYTFALTYIHNIYI